MEETQQVFLILVLSPCFRVLFALENDFVLRFTKIISWIIVTFQPNFLIKDKRCLLIQKNTNVNKNVSARSIKIIQLFKLASVTVSHIS